MERSFEREIIPMAKSEGILSNLCVLQTYITKHLIFYFISIGMALAPWNVLAGGKIRTDEEEEQRRQTGENGRAWSGDWERNDLEKKACKVLEEIAAKLRVKHITSGVFIEAACFCSVHHLDF